MGIWVFPPRPFFLFGIRKRPPFESQWLELGSSSSLISWVLVFFLGSVPFMDYKFGIKLGGVDLVECFFNPFYLNWFANFMEW